MKCPHCDEDKPNDAFRTRTDRRCNPWLVYLSNVCKECEAKEQRERNKRNRDNPEYRRKHNEWAKQAYHRNKEQRVLKAREYRSNPSSKEKRKEYIEKNRDKIFEQEKVCKRKYHERAVRELTDVYISQGIYNEKNNTLTLEEIRNNKELIELKRQYLILLRGLGKKRLYKKDYK